MNVLLDATYWIGFGFGVDTLLFAFQAYRKSRKYREELQKQQVMTLHQMQTLAKQKKILEGTVLVKTICTQSFHQQYQVNVGSNQVLFNLIPLTKHLQTIQTKINDNVVKQNGVNDWRADDKYTFKLPIITNPMLLKHELKYQSFFQTQNPGALTTIYKYTMATIACVPQAIFLALLNKNLTEDVIINGPTWGTLSVGVSLITNVPLILCCDIEKGTLIPKYLGITKSDIVDYLQDRQYKLLFYTGLLAIVMGLFYQRQIKKAVRRVFRWCSEFVKGLKNRDGPKRYSPEVDQDQSCIVCYAKCRNIVFGKCKHMILCNRCAYDDSNPVVVCPLCREQVDTENFLEVMEYKM